MRHHKSVTKLCIHNALRKLVVDLQLHQTRMLSQEWSHVSFSQFFKTWKDPLYTRHLKQQSPWRRKAKEKKYLQFISKLWSESASSTGHSICHQWQETALEKADSPSLVQTQRNHLLKCWSQAPNKLKIHTCEWSFTWDWTATTDSQPHYFPEDDRRSMMAPQVCFRDVNQPTVKAIS